MGYIRRGESTGILKISQSEVSKIIGVCNKLRILYRSRLTVIISPQSIRMAQIRFL